MEREDMLHRLKALIRLDVDALTGYDRAIREVPHPDVGTRLRGFRRDHERHVAELSSILREYGEDPPAAGEVTGVLTLGFSVLLGGAGPVGALEAMRTNETLTMTYYDEARARDFPPPLKVVLERNYGDELRHLAYVEEILATRPWEAAQEPSAGEEPARSDAPAPERRR